MFDVEKASAFAARMIEVLNAGSLCLMTSIGHRTGLFDAMRGQAPMTSSELAAKAQLQERYVREWLGAMVVSGIVTVEPGTVRYRLPDEHAAALTRSAVGGNVAAFTQYVPILGTVEDEIIACFREGGGVPYERFPRFHDVMAEDSSLSAGSALEEHILPLIAGLPRRLEQGIRVLDLGCGSGRILIRMAQLFPQSEFVGIDFSDHALGRARAEVEQCALGNIEFHALDLSDFHETAEPEGFDFITTFDAIHDQAKPLNVLEGIRRALKSDGVYLMQEIRGSSHVHENVSHPMGTFLYTVSCMHCMTVSLAQGGEGLGAMWGEQKAREYLRRAGFTSVERHRLAHDIQNDWYVVRP